MLASAALISGNNGRTISTASTQNAGSNFVEEIDPPTDLTASKIEDLLQYSSPSASTAGQETVPSVSPQEKTRRRASSAFWYDVLRVAQNRVFCLTKNGNIGWAPPGAKKGDQICVLFGGQVPFVVRAKRDSGRFQLLGETYFHGMMDGEALTLPKRAIEDVDFC